MYRSIEVFTPETVTAEFTPENLNYSPSREYNILFLRGVQNHLNHELQHRGYLFLNDAFANLGLERTKYDCVMGWIYQGGIGHVDLGVFNNLIDQPFNAYLDGKTDHLKLTFNTDGVIIDKAFDPVPTSDELEARAAKLRAEYARLMTRSD